MRVDRNTTFREIKTQFVDMKEKGLNRGTCSSRAVALNGAISWGMTEDESAISPGIWCMCRVSAGDRKT